MGPAARLDLLLSSRTVAFGFNPYVQLAQIEDDQLVSLGIMAAVVRSPIPKPASDE